MDPRFEQFKDLDWGSMSYPEKREVWLQISDMSAEDFDTMMAAQKARQDQVPKIGELAPDFKLERLDRTRRRTGEYVKLSDLRGKSVALCFGSYTWPPFREQSVRLNEIYEANKDNIEFFLVYVREAHPSDGWQTLQNLEPEIFYKAPKTADERAEIGHACQVGLDLRYPMLIDGLDDETEKNYVAAPIRLFVIGPDGKISNDGKEGPH